MEYGDDDWWSSMTGKPDRHLSKYERAKLAVLGELLKDKLRKSPSLRVFGGQKRRALGRFHRSMRDGNVSAAYDAAIVLGVSRSHVDAAFVLLEQDESMVTTNKV